MKIKKFLKIQDTKYGSKAIFKWLWNAWRGNRLQAVLNALIGLLSVAVSLLQVWAVQHAIDVAAHHVSGSIYWAVAVMGILILCDFGLNISSVWVRNILGVKAQNRMQQRMLDRILRSEWRGKGSLHSGDVLNRLEFDVGNVVNFLTETIPNTLSVLAMFFGAFFYLFSMDRILAFITVAIIPVFVMLSKVYISQMRRLTRKVRNSDSKVQSVLQETIQNRMLIKTLESDAERAAAECSQAHGVLGILQPDSQLRVCARISGGFPLGGREDVGKHPHLRRNDGFPAVGEPYSEPCPQPYQACSGLRECVYGGRATDGT